MWAQPMAVLIHLPRLHQRISPRIDGCAADIQQVGRFQIRQALMAKASDKLQILAGLALWYRFSEADLAHDADAPRWGGTVGMVGIVSWAANADTVAWGNRVSLVGIMSPRTVRLTPPARVTLL